MALTPSAAPNRRLDETPEYRWEMSLPKYGVGDAGIRIDRPGGRKAGYNVIYDESVAGGIRVSVIGVSPKVCSLDSGEIPLAGQDNEQLPLRALRRMLKLDIQSLV